MTKRILISIGTRPEAVKMAPLVHELRGRSGCEVQVLATAQHREMLDQILAFFEIEADIDLDLMRPGQGLADLSSRMITAVDRALEQVQPDIVLAQGDTSTVMVTGLCCFYRQLRFGHVEAGLRTGKKYSPFPEEMNRSLVGRLADWHFAPTERSAANLRAEGISDESIYVTGNTVIDALLSATKRVNAEAFRPQSGRRLLLVTAHRRENFGAPFESLCTGLRELAGRDDVELLYPVHPNPRVQEIAERVLGGLPHVRLCAPLDYPDFVAAMQAADLILTDSGGVQEEAPSLGKPILVLRHDTERPEGVDAGTAKLVGPVRERIVEEASRLLDDAEAYAEMAGAKNPYGDGTAAAQIADLLLATPCSGAR
ncbi:MAG: UDP-N-acetylglucosamine 2-epimerase (non-hydrolyzing) [Planctomycetota bacterium]|nr:MAG: UDP-N-acetylglucosamine 2-epimerase (non-hydrolyzing) [Planctomycetota bacterium]